MKRSKAARTSVVRSVVGSALDGDRGMSRVFEDEERDVLERAPMMKRPLRRRERMAGKM